MEANRSVALVHGRGVCRLAGEERVCVMNIHLRLILTTLLAGGLATCLGSPAQAQVRTSLSVAPGLAVGSSETGVAVSSTVAFDVGERTTVEGAVGLADRGPGAGAVYATGGVLFHLVPSGPRARPYVAMGAGVYHARFDLGHQRFFGGMGSSYPVGTVMTPLTGMRGFGMMGGLGQPLGTFYPGQMSGFYASRMGAMSVPSGGGWGMRSFTDPAVSLGGGVTIALTEHVFLRPDARALLVFADGGSSTVGIVTLGLGYRF